MKKKNYFPGGGNRHEDLSGDLFSPTYHPEKWSLVFFFVFFSLVLRWHGDWVTRQPGLKAAQYSRPCVALRESACGPTVHAWPWTLIERPWCVNVVWPRVDTSLTASIPFCHPFTHSLQSPWHPNWLKKKKKLHIQQGLKLTLVNQQMREKKICIGKYMKLCQLPDGQ